VGEEPERWRTNVFVGEYDRSVDGNGRLALPASFRDELGSRCYITADPRGFVSITTEATFEAQAQQLAEAVRTGEQPDSALRSFGVNTVVAAVDKQGRITLDETAREHAGINPGSQAKLAGAIESLQVWRPTRYTTIRGEDGVEQPARVWLDEDEEAATS
jgi:MraZ protein